jgi:hypothetical protein
MLNAQTGATLRDFYIGGPLNVLTSIGSTAAGQMEVVFPITAGGVTWGTGVPGDIVALTLQNVPLILTTVTSTSTSVSTTTVGGSVSTVTQTTTVGGGSIVTTTATTTVGGGTATVTSSTGGIDPTVTYGVAAVAVILAISTGYLAMRGRKAAP